MNHKVCVLLVLVAAIVCLLDAAPRQGEYNNYGAYGVPSLPPFGAPAQHPNYKVALRYESSTRTPYRIDSAYAYQVDGQSVQVARVDHTKY